MAFLRFLLILSIALSVPLLIAMAPPAGAQPAKSGVILPRAIQLKLHAHFEEQPLAFVARAEPSLG